MKWIKSFFKRFRKGHGLSLLIPYHITAGGTQREENWEWLFRYWKKHLPGAEIVIGDDLGTPFSKACAVNNAACKAKGDIFVVLDADGYISADLILDCAKRIREAREDGQRLWFVPYRHFFRLNEVASQKVLVSSPDDPYKFPVPPNNEDTQDTGSSQLGHWYGAMILIMPKEAFWTVGGMDPRFRGWGGEDHAFMRAVDTLYWKHKTTNAQVLHLWHPMLSDAGARVWVTWNERLWEGQSSLENNNDLSGRYYGAYGHVKRMRKLVDEGFKMYPIFRDCTPCQQNSV